MKLAGKITMLVGGIAFMASLAGLNYWNVGAGSQTLWSYTTREPVILTILAVVVCGLAIASVFAESFLLPFIATCVSFYLLGQFFYDGDPVFSHYGAGYWIGTTASVAMSVGGFLAVIAQQRAAKRAAAAAMSPPPPAYVPVPAPPPPVTTSPAGWYADASGQALERYWSGTAWTGDVRGEVPRAPAVAAATNAGTVPGGSGKNGVST